MNSILETNEQDLFNTNIQIKACDLIQNKGVTLALPDTVTPDDILIRGQAYHNELSKGLFLHGRNAIEEHAFSALSSINTGLSCIFFLKGDVDLTIGDRRFDFRNKDRNSMEAVGIFRTCEESFQRTTKKSQHVRYLVITATPEWLKYEDLAQIYGKHLNPKLLNNHMASHHWTPTSHLCKLVQDVLMPSTLMPEMLNLHLESRVIEIIAETISAMVKNTCSTDSRASLTRHDKIRLERARELIAENLQQTLSVEFIAQEAGISSSGLQRLFHRSEQCSVFEYVRCARLEKALSALQAQAVSVQEASTIAGYSSPANFTTAFKRKYGITPREVS